jgi:hypothetical protein
VGRNRPLCGDRTCNGVLRAPIGNEEGVSLRVDLVPVGLHERLPQERCESASDWPRIAGKKLTGLCCGPSVVCPSWTCQLGGSSDALESPSAIEP